VHACDVILNAVKDRLARIPGLEHHVVVDEERIVGVDELPWCWIQLGDEDVVGTSLDGKKQRSLQVQIDLIVRDRFALMQKANTLAASIEDHLDVTPRLGGLVLSIRLQSHTRSRADDTPIARLRLTYLVTYQTAAGAAAIPIGGKGNP
jgi:hypothetical protein